ncbi:flagellar biosynthetic protein FliO [Leptospira kmetyi]|nr:flagellar biosynthetic protein FliO [Leptospira kmetyi]TGK13667.1 flagellar biosynthetic protein FliO [Leptospira kmetyi]TGK29152.1 flagellar biosynthetic protein FliO [Leptospira kmetyi]TGL71843.1 flagellar biosynthetic protein FliO [Leptospira kmetyi]
MRIFGAFRADGRILGSVVAIFLIFNFAFVSLSAQSERELMDEALKKELGQSSSSKDEKKNSDSGEKKADSSSTSGTAGNTGEKTSNRETQTAPNPVEERYRPSDEGPGIAGTLFRVVFILGLLCAALYYILKYVSKNREGRLPVRGEMNILSSLMLGPNKQLQIVEISGRLLVLGVADNGINLITEIEDPEVKHRILQKKESFQPPEGGFLVTVLEQIKDLNSRISGTQEGPPDTSEKGGANREEKRRQARKKLDELKEKTSSLESGLFDLR